MNEENLGITKDVVLGCLRCFLLVMCPKIASGWLKGFNYEKQRKVGSLYVSYLAEQMTLGRFIPGTQIHICSFKGRKFLINGYHTLNAIIKAQIKIPLSVLTTEVQSMAEIDQLYIRHDVHKRRRFVESLKATGLSSAVSFSDAQAQSISSAAKLIQLKFKSIGGRTPKSIFSYEELQDLVYEWAEEGALYFKTIYRGPREMNPVLTRASTLSVALLTMRYQQENAIRFWEEVSKNDGLRRGDPRKILHEWLKIARESGGQRTGMDRRHSVYFVAAAWNAYIEKRKLSKLRPDLSLPFEIKGVPL